MDIFCAPGGKACGQCGEAQQPSFAFAADHLGKQFAAGFDRQIVKGSQGQLGFKDRAGFR